MLLSLYTHFSRPFWTGQSLAYPVVQKSGAAALAQRHCQRLIKDAYFPICETEAEWRGRGHKRIKRLSATDQATVKDLQPCYGGNKLLIALNRLDNIRKHQRLLVFTEIAAGVGFYRLGSLPAELDAIYRAQPPDDGYILARSVSDPNHKVQVRVEISFREIASLAVAQSSLLSVIL